MEKKYLNAYQNGQYTGRLIFREDNDLKIFMRFAASKTHSFRGTEDTYGWGPGENETMYVKESTIKVMGDKRSFFLQKAVIEEDELAQA